MQQREPFVVLQVLPDGFFAQFQPVRPAHQQAPVERDLVRLEDAVLRHDVEQVAAAVTHQRVELRLVEEPLLQAADAREHFLIALVLQVVEVVALKILEERVADAQGRVMHPQGALQVDPPRAQVLQLGERLAGGARILEEVRAGLLALEHRRAAERVADHEPVGHGGQGGVVRADLDASLAGHVRGEIGAVAAVGQADLERAGMIALLLRPEERQPFQQKVRRRLALAQRRGRGKLVGGRGPGVRRLALGGERALGGVFGALLRLGRRDRRAGGRFLGLLHSSTGRQAAKTSW